MVQPFERHSGRHGAVADHADHFVPLICCSLASTIPYAAETPVPAWPALKVS